MGLSRITPSNASLAMVAVLERGVDFFGERIGVYISLLSSFAWNSSKLDCAFVTENGPTLRTPMSMTASSFFRKREGGVFGIIW